MPTSEDLHLVPIGQVVKELARDYPDVTHSSLRFLEREKFIEPTRTAGGHRLFTPQDISRIRRIKEWQRERLSLDEIRARLEAADSLEPAPVLARRFLELAIAGDLHRARLVILQADDLGMPLVELFGDVLKPALYDLGARWESGEIPVGQEKEISAIIRDLVAELSLRHARAETNGVTIVAACVPGEYHELGLRMVAGLLEASGYTVHYLGPSVAPEFLIERVRRRAPAAILLTATRQEQLGAVETVVRALQADLPVAEVPPIVVGGQIVDENRARIKALGAIASYGDSIKETARALTQQITRPTH